MRDDILKKIEGLLAKTSPDSGATPAEIESAYAMIKVLCDKYQIDQSKIGEKKQKYVTLLLYEGEFSPELPFVCTVLDTHFFAKVVVRPGTIMHLYYFGTLENFQVVKPIFEHLRSSFKSLLEKRQREPSASENSSTDHVVEFNGIVYTVFHNSFNFRPPLSVQAYYTGLASALVSRLEQEAKRKDMEERWESAREETLAKLTGAVKASSELVSTRGQLQRVSEDLNSNFEDIFPNLPKTSPFDKPIDYTDSHSITLGVQDSRFISLNKSFPESEQE